MQNYPFVDSYTLENRAIFSFLAIEWKSQSNIWKPMFVCQSVRKIED